MKIRELVLALFRITKDKEDLTGFDELVSVRQKVQRIVTVYGYTTRKIRFHSSHVMDGLEDIVAEAIAEEDVSEYSFISSHVGVIAKFITNILDITWKCDQETVMLWLDQILSPDNNLIRSIFAESLIDFNDALDERAYTQDELIAAIRFTTMLGNDSESYMTGRLLSNLRRACLAGIDSERFTITIFLSPFEAKTAITEENSPVTFVRNVIRSLPADTDIQILNISTRESYGGNICFDYSKVEEFESIPNVSLVHNIVLSEDSLSPEAIACELPGVMQRLACSHMCFTHPSGIGDFFDEFDGRYKPVIISSDRFMSIHKAVIDLTFAKLQGNMLEVAGGYSDMQLFQAYTMMQDFARVKRTIDRMRVGSGIKPRDRLIILTDVPDGTLGDASAASKLFGALSKLPGFDDLEFYWIIRESNGRLKVRDFIPESVGTSRLIEITHWSHIYTDLRILSLFLTSRPLVLSYPTCNYLSVDQIQFLKIFGGRFLDIGEYDLNRDPLSGEHAGIVPFMQTGLLPKSLGIFSDPLSAKRMYPRTIDGVIPEDRARLGAGGAAGLGSFDPDVLDSILAPSGHNYFCYSNTNTESTINSANVCIEKFCIMALQRSLSLGVTNVNVMCRVNPEVFESMQDLIESDFTGRVATLLYKEKGRVITSVTLAEEGAVLTLDNVFPLTHDIFQRILVEPQRKESRRVEPFCLLTGDGSVTEGLMAGMTIMYQVQSWKYDFYKALVQASLFSEVTKDMYMDADFHSMGQIEFDALYEHEIYKTVPAGTIRYIVYENPEYPDSFNIIKIAKNPDWNFIETLESVSVSKHDFLYDNIRRLNKRSIVAACISGCINSFIWKEFSGEELVLPEELKKHIVSTWLSLQFIDSEEENKDLHNKMLHLLKEHPDALESGMKAFARYLHLHHNIRDKLAKVIYEFLQEMVCYRNPRLLKEITMPGLEGGCIRVDREVLQELPLLSFGSHIASDHKDLERYHEPRPAVFHEETIAELKRSKLFGCFLK